MMENSTSPDMTIGKTRKPSTEKPSSFGSTSKRHKNGKPVDSELSLCSLCTDLRTELQIGEPTVLESTTLAKDHFESLLENMNRPICVFCEIIGNAMPVNALPGVTEIDGPGASYSLESILLVKDGNVIDFRDAESYRLHTTIVKIDLQLHICTCINIMQCIDNKSNKRPIAVSETIDFEAPTAWLEHCKKEHTRGCGERNLSSRHFKPIDIILVDVIRGV
jgi:hypothetical protein